jgi:hypothetical protein
MITVSFGTRVLATAVTILAPFLAIPPASYSRPTMNPEMFCRNTSGMERWSHSSMKCAPLSADSENRMPLLATIPTGWPWMRANAVTSVVPYSDLNSWNRDPSTTRRITSRTS